jgi:hypothetical protein
MFVSPNAVNMLQQIHGDSWFWILLFFVLSVLSIKKEKPMLKKVSGIALRLFSALMIVTGVGMVIAFQFPLTYVIKGILAIGMIGIMEAILMMTSKGKKTGPFWIVLIALLALVLLIAFGVLSF